MLKIGIVTGRFSEDPTSQELLEAANNVGEAQVVDPIQFTVRIGDTREISVGKEKLTNFDVLVIRGLNFSGEPDFQFEVFEELNKAGVLLVNSPAAIQIAESKFLTSYILQEKGFPVPTSLVIQRLASAEEFIEKHKDVIAKPLYGFQGYGVIRVKSSERDAMGRIKRLLSEFKCVCLQEYIPNPGRDIRAFVVGEEVVASIYRVAKVGRWKTNIRAGAEPTVCRLTNSQRKMAVQASRILGLDYTGVDIIEGPERDYILEVNGAPAWAGVMEATGRNVAEDIINYVARRLGRRAG